MLWLIVSNAFWRSVKIIPASTTSSKSCKTLSFKKKVMYLVSGLFFNQVDYMTLCDISSRPQKLFVLSRMILSKTLDDRGSSDNSKEYNGSVLETFLTRGFSFSI